MFSHAAGQRVLRTKFSGEPECTFISVVTVSVAFFSCNAGSEKDRYVIHSWYVVN